MARPSWCEHPFCRQVCGGPMESAEEDPDSGMACGGMLPTPIPHREGKNTHRLCLKGCDDPVTEIELNASDLWYIGQIVKSLSEHARGEADAS